MPGMWVRQRCKVEMPYSAGVGDVAGEVFEAADLRRGFGDVDDSVPRVASGALAEAASAVAARAAV